MPLFLGPSQKASSGASSETFLLGGEVEGSFENTFLHSESVGTQYFSPPSSSSSPLPGPPVPIQLQEACVWSSLQWDAPGSTLSTWYLTSEPFHEGQWKKGKGRGWRCLWFRLCSYCHSKWLKAWLLLSFLTCFFRQLLFCLAAQHSVSWQSSWHLGYTPNLDTRGAKNSNVLAFILTIWKAIVRNCQHIGNIF